MKDHLGTEIKVGDWIAYTGSGNMASMRIGKVIGIEDRKRSQWSDEIVPRLKVRGANKYTTWSLGKPGFLGYPGNCVVLDRSLIPSELVALYA